MKEKLGDLIPWVEKLEIALVKANLSEDPDEVERRSQLARFAPPSVIFLHMKLILSWKRFGGHRKTVSSLNGKGKTRPSPR